VSFADGQVREVNSAVGETDLGVDGFDGPGTYEGKIDLTPGADGGEVSVSVEAEHWWLWPTLALVVGIVFALGLRRLRGAVRPGLVLLAGEAEQGEGEEQQRDEGEDREVGDHRGQVGAAVGQELVQDPVHGAGAV
jgi:hypothetical protein